MDFDIFQSPSPSPSNALTTVNPAKLHIGASPEPAVVQGPRPKAHPIPRICSDWGDNLRPGASDWKSDLLGGVGFKAAHAGIDGWQELYLKYLTWDYQIPIDIPADPQAELGATVAVKFHGDAVSIYDAYLLRANIARNENEFKRYQIVYTPHTELYTVIARNGRVGLFGESTIVTYSNDLNVAVSKFEDLFLQSTGYTWKRRYLPPPIGQLSPNGHIHVDLDYSFPTNNDLLFLESPKQSRRDELPKFNMDEPYKRLLEDILFGGPVRTCTPIEGATQSRPSLPGTTPCTFTAPRQHLSLWTVMAACNILRAIISYLEPKPNKTSAIRWKTIIQASSMYRSTIPFYSGWFNSDRPPVICNYHAVLTELEFLQSLFPRQEIAAMMKDIKYRATAQEMLYGQALATHPLYQAYSSLRHGFRLLTDTSSQEFQQLRNYLEESNQSNFHRMSFQLQGIYRVFTKAKLANPYHNWIRSSTNNTTPSSRPSRLLLWHGTPLTSLLGILEHGLQIRNRCEPPPSLRSRKPRNPPPPANLGITPGVINTSRMVSARRNARRQFNTRPPRPGMFGDGIYLADASSKSAGYCQALGMSDGEAVLLLCEADVGDEGKRVRTYHTLPDGHDIVGEFGGREVRCIEGVGRTGPRRVEHGGWKRIGWDMDCGGGLPRGDCWDVWMPDTSKPYTIEDRNATLFFNEYVLFDPAHVQIRYIFRLKINQTNRYW